MSVCTMTVPKKKGTPGSRSRTRRRRTANVMIRVTKAYREWLVELAEFKQMTLSDMIDDAVSIYARNEGFSKMPPKR